MKKETFLIGLLTFITISCENSDMEHLDKQEEILCKETTVIREFQQRTGSINADTPIYIEECETKTFTVSTGLNMTRSENTPDSTNIEIKYIKFSQNGKKGYAILSDDYRLNRMYVFSNDGCISDTTFIKPLKRAIDEVPYIAQEDIQNHYTGDSIQTRSTNFVSVGPIVKTQWHQNTPFNNLIPNCRNHNVKAYAGCVTIATAQLIAHCKRFTGTYYGNKNINFDELIKSDIYGNPIYPQQIASFVHEVAMFCQVRFGCSQEGGSSSYIKSAFQYLKELGYSGYMSEGAINPISLYTDLNKNIPHLSSGQSDDGGHMWIVDGIQGNYDGNSLTNVMYHCNWGWGISSAWVADYRNSGAYYFSSGNKHIYITNY